MSTGAGAGLLIVGLLIGAGVVYALAPSLGLTSTSSGTATVTNTSTVTSIVTQTGAGGGLSGTIPIGFLDDLSSGLAFQGVRSNVTARLAISDINAWLAQSGESIRFSIAIQDYALDTTKALQIMGAFKTQGIQAVVGPLNSGTATGILQFANTNHIVLISPSSTSPLLAIPNDYLYRTAPNDISQGAADARIMLSSGAQAVIILYRQDSYGTGLTNATSQRLTALGGHVVDKIPYDATAADSGTLDFTPILQQVSTDWNSAVTTYGAGHVALYVIAFDEITNILTNANKNFPSLLSTQLPWFGDDGWAADFKITGNSTVAPLGVQVRGPSTIFGYSNSSKTASVCARLLAQANLGCESYSLGAYDDVWLAALSILACGKNDGACIQSTISTVANNYFGATGWTTLQPSGDRAYGDFLIWCIVSTVHGPDWIICGSWSQLSDSVTWTAKPTGVS